jgi:putative thioredoxin
MTSDRPHGSAVFDTDTARFGADVIERSRTTTVAVDFWAPWCSPCRALAPVLEQLADGYGGRLLVARVNIDEEPGIAAQFGVRSIPDVRIFRDGRQVDGFVGAQPAARLKPLFDRHVPRASEGLREQAQARLRAGDAAGAVALLRQLLAEDPQNDAARIDLADALARSGDIAGAEESLAALPASVAASKSAEPVRARIHFLHSAAAPGEIDELRRQAAADGADLEGMHRLAAYELLHGDATRGMELLLSIMQRDRRFQDELGRRSLLHAFQLLGESDERVARFRRRMTALLY